MRNSFAMLPIAVLAAACAPDFAPYNRLESLRVLAVRAEPPTPAYGQTTQLSALIYAPPAMSYSLQWSWCPFTRGNLEGYACAVDEAELQATIDETLPPGVSFVLPPFDLGAGAAAELEHVFVPELLVAACDALLAGGLPAGVPAPDCARGLPVNIRLEVLAADQQVVAVKELLLRGASGSENHNPQLDGLEAALVGEGAAPVAVDGSSAMVRGREYELGLETTAAQAEPYVDGEGGTKEETLVFTWFVEAGETDLTRTALAPGRTELDVARRNLWTTPERAALARDEARLFVVVRDNRGGTGWLERRVQLREE